MNDFTASNGVRIWEAPRSPGALDFIDGEDGARLPEWTVAALREFFQAEADERIGRWRSAVAPDFVVYEPREGQPARVLRESTAQVLDYQRSETQSTHPSAFESVARAYFDAHPEPKPWHDAVVGEFWAVRMGADNPRVCRVIEPPSLEEGSAFLPVDHGGKTWFRVTAPTIVSAVRIWPEVSS